MSNNTLNAYGRDLATYATYLRKSEKIDNPADISQLILLNYLTYLKKNGLSPRSRARVLSALRSFHRFLLRENYVEHDPSAQVESPRSLASLPKLLSHHNITRNQLIDFGILLGTDFNEKVPRVGPKTGLRLIQEHNNLEEMPEKIRAQLPDNYEEIRQLFLQPKVTTDYTIDFGSLQEEELVTFLCQKRGFSITQVQSVINRLKQATTQKTQVGLERWL